MITSDSRDVCPVCQKPLKEGSVVSKFTSTGVVLTHSKCFLDLPRIYIDNANEVNTSLNN